MKKISPVLILLAPLSFLIGIWWSLHSQENQRSTSSNNSLKILAQTGFLPQDFVSFLHSSSKFHIEIDEYATYSEFLFKLESKNKYDLIQTTKDFENEVAKKVDLVDLTHSLSSYIEAIHVDFLPPLQANEKVFFAPLQWGVFGWLYKPTSWPSSDQLSVRDVYRQGQHNIAMEPNLREALAFIEDRNIFIESWDDPESLNFLKEHILSELKNIRFIQHHLLEPIELEDFSFIQMDSGLASQWLIQNKEFAYLTPIDQCSLWVQTLAITSDSPRQDLAAEFLLYMATPKYFEQLIAKGHRASVFAAADSLDIHPMQKPSYLRSLDLTRIRTHSPSLATLFKIEELILTDLISQ